MPKDLKHIAIVMDGNGRWATNKGLSRSEGHKEGADTLKKIVKAISDLGISYVTLYAFSTENWKRTEKEVGFLMTLMAKRLRAELNFYAENQLRFLHIGDMKKLPKEVQKEIINVKERTAHYTGTTVSFAINYGGQDEIIRAIKKTPLEEIPYLNEQSFTLKLDTANIPPVDLLIRTGGEKRLSNFLLWQSAYAELYFCDKLWPEWTADDLNKAIKEFENRNRRYGNA